LHMAQLMPLPLTASCISKIQIGFTFLVTAHPGSPGQRAVKRLCVCVCVWLLQNPLRLKKPRRHRHTLETHCAFTSAQGVLAGVQRSPSSVPLTKHTYSHVPVSVCLSVCLSRLVTHWTFTRSTARRRPTALSELSTTH